MDLLSLIADSIGVLTGIYLCYVGIRKRMQRRRQNNEKSNKEKGSD